MPAFDSCHPQVVRALEKSGWRIADHSPRFFFDDRLIIVDIEASREQGDTAQDIILVEVKCFPDVHMTTYLYGVIGQYLVYRAMLDELGVASELYLSVPESIYADSGAFDSVMRRVIRDHQIQLVIIALDEERILQWIK